MTCNKNFVSIIIPCRNEEKYINTVLEEILSQDFPKDYLEVLVIDGRSEDNTRNIIRDYVKKYPIFKLVDNQKKTVPFALNLGIKKSKGDYILRMDAHAKYPNNYISKLLYWLDKLDADNVGAVWITHPSSDKIMAQAVSHVLSHPFGVGNAYFRIGTTKPKEVDTVPFGCYRREVFDKIGLFDEELIRNQDDEFNARLKRNGGKIYLIPEVQVVYYARASFNKLRKMYYQYGYFKPLVNIKLGKPANLRQFVPVLFILSLIFFLTLSIFVRGSVWIFFLILCCYLVLNIYFSVKIAFGSRKILCLYIPIAFAITHFSYGIAYFAGLLDFYILKKHLRGKRKDVSLSR